MVGLTNAAPKRGSAVGVEWGVQVAPPSLVRSMTPSSARNGTPHTAGPVLALTKETLLRALVVPLDWGVQVAPPSVVRRMVPSVPTGPLPTTVPMLAST